MKNLIRTFNLDDYKNASTRDTFVNCIGEELKKNGSFMLRNHGILKSILLQAIEYSKRFFDLPADVKLRYKHNGHQIGYTSLDAAPGVKEFFQISDCESMPQILEVPGFTHLLISSCRVFEAAAIEILRPIALSLSLAEDYFDQRVDCCVIQAIHYPITQNQYQLLCMSANGLQLRWDPVTINDSDLLLVNCADMLDTASKENQS